MIRSLVKLIAVALALAPAHLLAAGGSIATVCAAESSIDVLCIASMDAKVFSSNASRITAR